MNFYSPLMHEIWPMNYASDNLSIDGFEYGYATQGLNLPIKNDMGLIEAALSYFILIQNEF
jgi:hypothetical protein